jgi:hypothetical protein
MTIEFTGQSIHISTPIYDELDLSGLDELKIYKLFTSGSLDAYCPTCKKSSVFRIENPNKYISDPEKQTISKYGLIEVKAICTRSQGSGYAESCDQKLFSIFERNAGSFTKIGLSPSKAVLDFGDLDDAFKELDDSYRKELGTAIGLFAHGVGIGSFVYLRRIFEVLVEEAHVKAQEDKGWDEELYSKKRMNEKVESLKDFLPSRLVRSINLYGILSKGIHELTEAECKTQYPLVLQAIQLILKEKHEENQYDNVVKSLGKK